MRCFDLKTNTWSDLPPLPEPLQNISAVMHEGKIVVEGATMRVLESGEPTNEFLDDEEAEERVYVYDPTTATWTQASSEGMITDQTLVSDGGKLRLLGGFRPDGAVYEGEDELPDEYPEDEDYTMPVLEYDLATGVGKAICKVRQVNRNPIAVAKDGAFYIYNPQNYNLIRVTREKKEHLNGALPKIVLPKEGEERMSEQGQRLDDPLIGRTALCLASDGIVLTGLPAADGSSDTFILRDGSDTFEPYEKRISDARVQSIAACTYRGRLFAIGSSWIEPDQRFFRATAMDVPEYPGDIPCDKDEPMPEPAPKPAPALPKTSDPNVPVPVLVGIGACGVAAVVTGIILRRKK